MRPYSGCEQFALTALTLVQMVSWLFQLLIFMFKSAMFCYSNNFSFNLLIFGLNQIWECALNWFTMELVHKQNLDICHLHDWGATYPIHFFFVDPYVQMIPNWFQITLDATYPKHLPLECLVGHVLTGVNPCGRCSIVTLLLQTTKLLKKP